MDTVRRAVRRGDLPKLDGTIECQDCGEPATCYDHRNYLHPLAVDPVCKGCNNRRGPGFPLLTDEDVPEYHNGIEGKTGKNWSVLENPLTPNERCQTSGYETIETGDDLLPAAITERTSPFRDVRDHFGSLRFRLAWDDYSGGREVAGGLFRAEYFKRHDPFFVDEAA